jgi:hypothetical protein
MVGINGLESKRQRQPTNHKDEQQRKKIIGIVSFITIFVVFIYIRFF